MVRITLYDPKISAEVYSRRRAAEQPFESPVAAGLGQLGRALTEREERRAPGHQDKTMAMKVLGRMRKEEFARLKKESGYRTLEHDWSAKGYVLEYVKRRDETLTDLAKTNPRAAKIVAEGKIATAAFRQRLKEDPEAAKEELAAGEFGDALPQEQAETLMAKSDQAVKVRQRQSEAAAKSSEDQFVSELRTYKQRLLEGEAPDDETFSDEAIMAQVSPEVADRLIRERDRAEARGNAFAEIQFMSEAELEERLGEAERDEVRHLLWARGHRRQLMKQGPAAFALRDPVVGQAHERWLQARADGDAAAAGQAGLAYANAALALQRRMGLSASEQGVLTVDMAAELVRQSELPDGPDAAALGTMLRDQLGEHWRVALADLERAGLSEQAAIIAGLDRPGQQPAARQLAGLVGTRTSDLRQSAGDAAAAIDHLLGIAIGGAQGAPGDHAIGADTSRGELVRRRAYALAAEGWATNRAVQRAIEDLSAANSSQSGGPEELSFEVLAESQGIHPSALGSGGAAVRSILERFTRYYDLSDIQRDDLNNDIRQLDGEKEGYSVLRDRAVDLENAAGFFAPAEEPVGPETVPSPFEQAFEDFLASDGAGEPAALEEVFSRLRGDLLLARPSTFDNRTWVNDALTGDDPRRRDFAARFLGDAVNGVALRHILSEPPARARYVEYWRDEYRSNYPPAADTTQSPVSAVDRVAHAVDAMGGLGIPREVVEGILVDISQTIDADGTQRDHLIRHISQVVSPFDWNAGLYLQQAVWALSVGADRVGEIPGRFAALLSDELLIKAALARGFGRLNYSTEPQRPPGLDAADHAIGGGGTALAAAGVFMASGPWGLAAAGLGFLASGAGYANAIDDANDEHNDYLIQKEIFDRFQDPEIFPRIRCVEKSIFNPGEEDCL